jgi:hypothetical protein
VHEFQINALVDGGIIATEWDMITVTNVPEPATWVMMLAGLGLVAGHRRKGRLDDAIASAECASAEGGPTSFARLGPWWRSALRDLVSPHKARPTRSIA